jgi:uncharacterized protein YggE
MKNTINFIIIIFCYLFVPELSAQDNFPPNLPVINVTGTANIKVVPDLMKWSLTVKVDADDVVQAKNGVDKSVSKILQIFKDKDVDEKDAQTSGIRMMKNYDYYRNNTKEFSASNEIWFTLKDVSRYEEFASALILIDNTYINNIQFDYSKSIETRRQARTDALLAAKSKAEQMAEVLGQNIGKAVYISESSSSYYPNPFNVSTYGTTNQNFGTSSTFSEGTISIEARVQIVFELLNK